VQWLKADALEPETYSHLLPGVSAVVHTLGTLLPDTRYKDALRTQDLAGAVGSFVQSLVGAGGNPLEERPNGHETLNRDSGLLMGVDMCRRHSNTDFSGLQPCGLPRRS
jgi:hypothetical protein